MPCCTSSGRAQWSCLVEGARQRRRQWWRRHAAGCTGLARDSAPRSPHLSSLGICYSSSLRSAEPPARNLRRGARRVSLPGVTYGIWSVQAIWSADCDMTFPLSGAITLERRPPLRQSFDLHLHAAALHCSQATRCLHATCLGHGPRVKSWVTIVGGLQFWMCTKRKFSCSTC